MIPKWKWDKISMNFISELSLFMKKKDTICVIVDCLMKPAHFILIVRLYDVLVSVIPDRDLQEALVTVNSQALYGHNVKLWCFRLSSVRKDTCSRFDSLKPKKGESDLRQYKSSI
ncbi:integrase [Gossypium australe]|uniref:Integrase n=1 Tax=Gossypium australe TaxID=47621 RepID=A0A5B6WGF6_9ROSI|nr:integrase [Gossypium australe]